MDKHLTVLGILYIALNALGLIGAGLVLLAVGGGSLLADDFTAMSIGLMVALFVSGFLIVTSVPGIIAGIGLLKRASWARTVGLIVAALSLINFPFGTILGAYAIWVLVQDESVRLLGQRTPGAVAA